MKALVLPAVVTAAILASCDAALAHEAGEAVRTGSSAWDVAALLLLAAGGVLYLRGTIELNRRGARVRTGERAAFWMGWAAMLAAITPPMDAAAAQSFSSHMVQHELLMLLGAPLMIVGRPILPWLWALPAGLRRIAGQPMQTAVPASAWRWLTYPALAWAIHGGVIWVWHAPVLYEAALESEAVHALQHATFVGTAVLFWWGLIYGRYGRPAYGASAVFVFVTMMHTGALGALFALSTRPYYELYRHRGEMAGIDAIRDQQLAGLYMWIPSGVVLTIFALALILAWLSESERRSVRR